MIAARPFSRAAVRYRILAAAFALAAFAGPLALVAARFRTSPPAFGAGPVLGAVPAWGGSFAPPALALGATVAAVLLLELAFELVKLRRVKRGAVPLGRLGVRRARIATSRTVATPTAIGYLHPAVVVPEGFAARVDAREWDAIVAHECAHLARHDDWAKALQSALLRAGWWLPGLWILGRALDLERELASDERAAGATGARRYAACLLRLATDRGTDALAPAFGARRSHVAIRVERLLRPVRGGGPLLRAVALGAFTAAAFALAGAVVLAVPGTGARAAAVHRIAARHAAPAAPHVRVAQRIRHPGQLASHRTLAFAAVAAPAGRAEGPPAALASARDEAPAPRAAAPARAREEHPAAAADAVSAHQAAGADAVSAHQAAGAGADAVSARQVAGADAVSARRTAPRVLAPERSIVVADLSGGSGSRRVPGRRPPSVRATLTPAETLALATTPSRSRCATCFGPLRSADDAVGGHLPALAPQAGGTGGGSAAIAADDPTAGPVTLTSQMIWFLIPNRVMQRP